MEIPPQMTSCLPPRAVPQHKRDARHRPAAEIAGVGQLRERDALDLGPGETCLLHRRLDYREAPVLGERHAGALGRVDLRGPRRDRRGRGGCVRRGLGRDDDLDGHVLVDRAFGCRCVTPHEHAQVIVALGHRLSRPDRRALGGGRPQRRERVGRVVDDHRGRRVRRQLGRLRVQDQTRGDTRAVVDPHDLEDVDALDAGAAARDPGRQVGGDRRTERFREDLDHPRRVHARGVDPLPGRLARASNDAQVVAAGGRRRS